MVPILVEKGSDPNAINSSGACSLHFACYKDTASIGSVGILLEAGANPNVIESSYGCSPLHYSAGTGNIAFCQMLLKHGADITVLDSYQYSSSDYAREAGFEEIASFLDQEMLITMNGGRRDQLQEGNNKTKPPQYLSDMDSLSSLDSPSPDKIKRCSLDEKQQQRFNSNPTNNNNQADDQDFSDIFSQRTTNHLQGGSNGSNNTNHQGGGGDGEWEEKVDQLTDETYFQNSVTGQIIWEVDISSMPQSDGGGGGRGFLGLGKKNKHQQEDDFVEFAPQMKDWMNSHIYKIRIMAVLGKYDPKKVLGLDAILKLHKGRESQLLDALCKQYKCEEDEDFAFLGNARCLGGDGLQTRFNSSSMNSIEKEEESQRGSFSNRDHIEEEVTLIEDEENLEGLSRNSSKQRVLTRNSSSFMELTGKDGAVARAIEEAKLALEESHEVERRSLKGKIQDKETELARLQATIMSLENEGGDLSDKLNSLRGELTNNSSLSRGEIEQKVGKIKELTTQVTSLESTIASELSKNQSLNEILEGLKSDEVDRVEVERRMADERASVEKEREIKFRNDLEGLRESLEGEIKSVKDMWMEDKANLVKEREDDVRNVKREFAKEREDMAQVVARAKLESTDASERANLAVSKQKEAENWAQSLHDEVVRAREIDKYNAQLHQDLFREQQRRKMIHNTLEDMKGRIRVYVRIRPMSTKEKARNCENACIQDGKGGCSVVSRDETHSYSFDQVFSGSSSSSSDGEENEEKGMGVDNNSNMQVDLFFFIMNDFF